MRKVSFLLINAPSPNLASPANFPIGIGYIASNLLKNGHCVQVLDLNLHKGNGEEMLRRIFKMGEFDVFGIGALTPSFEIVKFLAKAIKKKHPGSLLVLGNSLATFSPELVLKETAGDIACIGEAEEIMIELAADVKRGLFPDKIAGTCVRVNETIVRNETRPPIKDLDNLGSPAYELFDMSAYINQKNIIFKGFRGYHKMKDLKNIAVETSRGCWNRCNFCCKVAGNGVINYRSVDFSLDEIGHLVRTYDIKIFNIVDNLFVSNKKRVLDFCKGLKARNLNIFWAANARLDIMDDEMLKKMYEAGCRCLFYGLESGDNRILKKIEKHVDLNRAAQIIRKTLDVGIFPRCSVMIGMFGENEETLRNTYEFIKRTDIYPNDMSFATPFPGTAFYLEALIKGYIGNELGYLKKLGNFYLRPAANVTGWEDEELMKRKHTLERRLLVNFYKRHPGIFIQQVVDILGAGGYRTLMKKILHRIAPVIYR